MASFNLRTVTSLVFELTNELTKTVNIGFHGVVTTRGNHFRGHVAERASQGFSVLCSFNSTGQTEVTQFQDFLVLGHLWKYYEKCKAQSTGEITEVFNSDNVSNVFCPHYTREIGKRTNHRSFWICMFEKNSDREIT